MKLLLCVSVIALTGCFEDGDIGPVGPQGVMGAMGTTGAQGAPGTMGNPGLNSLINQITLPLGNENCRFGGTQFDSGLDVNSNGILETSEVTETSIVCNGDKSVFELQILHFADVDGGGDIINNAPRFSAILDSFRSGISNTLVLSSGDNWIPGPEYNVASDPAFDAILGVAGAGRAHVAWLNEMGVQASALGNHEFDLGPDDIAGLISQDGAYAGATFPYLSTNLDFSMDADLGPLAVPEGSEGTANSVAAFTVINVGGERVGIIGATTPTLENISSPGNVAVLPADDSTAGLAGLIQEDIDTLTARGIDKIILLGHMQTLSVERELASLLSGVDIIIGGGSNTLLADENDRLRDGDTSAGDYPEIITSASGEPVLLVNTDGDYNYLGRLVVEFDMDDGTIFPEFLDSTVNGAYATDSEGLTGNGLTEFQAIAGVDAISDALQTGLEDLLGNTFGATSVFLDGRRSQVRTQETNMGNLTADANLALAQTVEPGVQISLKNGGGIRAEIGFAAFPPGSTNADDLEFFPPPAVEGVRAEGEVSQLDIETTLRFNNGLTLVSLTGAELADMMEHAVGFDNVGVDQSGRFPQIGGMIFSFDPSQTGRDTDGVGSRLQSLVVMDDNGAAAGGSPVTIVENGTLNAAAATQVFRMVTLDFLFNTDGDGYPFSGLAAANPVFLETALATGSPSGTATFAANGSEQDALAEYLASNFPTMSPFSEAETATASDTRIVNLSVTP